MKIINPATEEIIKEIEEDTFQTLEKKFNALKQSQHDWQKISLQTRAEIIKKFADLLEENIEHLSIILTSETGKPLQQSRNEINGGRAKIKWLTDNATKYLSDEIMSTENGMEEK